MKAVRKTHGAKNAAFIAAVVIMCVLMGSFSGCQSTKAHKTKIGVIFYQADDTFLNMLREYIVKTAKEYERKSNIKISVNFVDSGRNQSIQNDQVDRFIAQRYDVICVNMVDRTAASIIIDKAENADIPLVFFNREPVSEDLTRWEKLFYVGAKSEQSGVLQGEIVNELFDSRRDSIDKNRDGKLQYIMLEGEQGHQDAMLRTEYSIATIVKAGIEVDKLANDSMDWQYSLAKEKMLIWLNQFGPAIEAVLSNNDDMALGAIDALNSEGYNLGGDKYIHVIGADGTSEALEAISRGSMYATVVNDAQSQGRAIFEIAYSIATEKTAETSVDGFDGKYLRCDYRVQKAEDIQDD